MTMGRPTIYTDALAEEICREIAEGHSLISLCRKHDHFPSHGTVFRWLTEKPDFRDKYTLARDMQADVLFDECLPIADDASNDFSHDSDGNIIIDHDAVNRAKLKIDTRKWMAGKMRPKKYGDKFAVGGAEDLPPIQTSSTLDISKLTIEQLEALKAALTGGSNE
jgi:hypothetical protein